MPTPPRTVTSIFIVILIGLLWGLNWPAVKFMLSELPPLTIRAVAFPMAALLLALIAKAMGQPLMPRPDEWGAIVRTGLLLVFGFNISTSLGQVFTETSRAAIIAYTMPALTALFAVIFLKERLDAPRLLALLLSMCGLAVLASENVSALIAAPLGPAIMFCAALSWALGNVALKAGTWSLQPLALTVWFFVFSTLACWPLVLIFEPPWQQAWPSAPVLWTLIYHALGPMVTAYACWTVLVGRLPATVAAIAALLAPIVGVLSAIILIGDPLTWQKTTALAMVLASIILTLRVRESPKPQASKTG